MTRIEAVVVKRTAAAILVKVFRHKLQPLAGQVVWLPKQLVREWPGLNVLDVEDWLLRKKEREQA